MLTRILFKRNLRITARFLSDKGDKSKDVDNTSHKTINEKDVKNKEPQSDPRLSAKEEKEQIIESSTKRVQELLKIMLTAPKTNGEYPFTQALERSKKQNPDEEITMEKIEKSITKAAGEVAEAIGGDVKHTEAELLSKVLGKINQTSTSLSDLLVGMKVDRNKEKDDLIQTETRGQQVKRLVNKSKVEAQRIQFKKTTQRQTETEEKQKRINIPQPTVVDIFSEQPLGIFQEKEPNFGTNLDVWNKLKQRELNLAISQPPANYFQKMILWTEQGKVWKFPINNEQGLEEEENIHFSEHIFLDQHLEDWCPKKGPIRHFMELVCVGLSKNAFYTVQEKTDHIMWYKEYFESKKDLLVEVGAWDAPKTKSEVTE